MEQVAERIKDLASGFTHSRQHDRASFSLELPYWRRWACASMRFPSLYGPVEKNGVVTLEKREGTLTKLHGRLGFIDSIDLYNRKNAQPPAEALTIVQERRDVQAVPDLQGFLY